MKTSKELLDALQAEYASEQQKRRELNVLVLQHRPETVKNMLDPEDIYAQREIDRLSKDLIRLQRENKNMEQYVDYLKNKDKPA